MFHTSLDVHVPLLSPNNGPSLAQDSRRVIEASAKWQFPAHPRHPITAKSLSVRLLEEAGRSGIPGETTFDYRHCLRGFRNEKNECKQKSERELGLD